MFDSRVAVDRDLAEGGYVQCHACRRAAKPSGTEIAGLSGRRILPRNALMSSTMRERSDWKNEGVRSNSPGSEAKRHIGAVFPQQQIESTLDHHG